MLRIKLETSGRATSDLTPRASPALDTACSQLLPSDSSEGCGSEFQWICFQRYTQLGNYQRICNWRKNNCQKRHKFYLCVQVYWFMKTDSGLAFKLFLTGAEILKKKKKPSRHRFLDKHLELFHQAMYLKFLTSPTLQLIIDPALPMNLVRVRMTFINKQNLLKCNKGFSYTFYLHYNFILIILRRIYWIYC